MLETADADNALTAPRLRRSLITLKITLNMMKCQPDAGRATFCPVVADCRFSGLDSLFRWTFFAEVQNGVANDRIVGLIGIWAVPTLLIAVLWLLSMRNSHREAARFADVAQQLRTESDLLAARMRTVNEEISLARAFLAQNARELETVGRQSSRQLTEAAEQLSAALADSDQKAKTLEIVSNAATSNLEQLRKHLPVVTSAAKMLPTRSAAPAITRNCRSNR